jgi:hypothetical protein
VWKIAYGQQAVEEYKLLDGFPSSKAVWPLLRMSYGRYVHRRAEQVKMWIEWGQLPSKTEESLGVKLPTFWEFHVGRITVFLKTVWTCTELLPSSCPKCPLWFACLWNFGYKEKDFHSTSSLLTRWSTMWLLSFLKT